ELLDTALDEAWSVIVDNRHVLDRLVEELLERETLGEHELAEIFRDVKKQPPREVWVSSAERPALAAPSVGSTTTATGTEEHDAGEPLQPNPPELPHPGGEGPQIPGAPHGGEPGSGSGSGGYGYDTAEGTERCDGRGPAPHRSGREGGPPTDRRGPGPRRPRGYPRTGRPHVRRGLPGCRPGRERPAVDDVRHRPPGARAGAGHRLLLHVRAPS